jgi:hypothetical protein
VQGRHYPGVRLLQDGNEGLKRRNAVGVRATMSLDLAVVITGSSYFMWSFGPDACRRVRWRPLRGSFPRLHRRGPTLTHLTLHLPDIFAQNHPALSSTLREGQTAGAGTEVPKSP